MDQLLFVLAFISFVVFTGALAISFLFIRDDVVDKMSKGVRPYESISGRNSAFDSFGNLHRDKQAGWVVCRKTGRLISNGAYTREARRAAFK